MTHNIYKKGPIEYNKFAVSASETVGLSGRIRTQNLFFSQSLSDPLCVRADGCDFLQCL